MRTHCCEQNVVSKEGSSRALDALVTEDGLTPQSPTANGGSSAGKLPVPAQERSKGVVENFSSTTRAIVYGLQSR
jgi:hypothetical protein